MTAHQTNLDLGRAVREWKRDLIRRMNAKTIELYDYTFGDYEENPDQRDATDRDCANET